MIWIHVSNLFKIGWGANDHVCLSNLPFLYCFTERILASSQEALHPTTLMQNDQRSNVHDGSRIQGDDDDDANVALPDRNLFK